MSGQYALMVPWERHRGLLTLEEVASQCALHPSVVERFVTLGLIEPDDAAAGRFAPEVTRKIHCMLRLRRDLGINYQGLALVLELLERIEHLETRLRQYEGQQQETTATQGLKRRRRGAYGSQ